ncbi:MAG: glycosyltransferase [Hyphomicrobiaceae bacterium]
MHYAKALTGRGLQNAARLNQPRRARIGIYSRGVHDSVAFRIPEYMALGLAIVCNPIRYQPVEPLIEGRNYLAYTTPDECIAQCRRLLADPALADSMGRANRAYYNAHAKPAVQMAMLLDDAFTSPPGDDLQTDGRPRMPSQAANILAFRKP